ncbi:hypothetical protein ASO20_00950 [Mycoplasma sp. (ex Biomphalaria glabrata)]|uniref:APC family permease n=1 Tax=Mycoplasma sp. (ex Biomphalaria glabrata) TaxID=1749074 RepID=UPI00073AC64E|nr:APC family permease [Mycoplasma sp. (ex Biomphalaria glabrata)]ALV23237.1 hypothetical protein ASO20_00950 [Mycoplasma sp. (ex Biomphalaria glabrata)]
MKHKKYSQRSAIFFGFNFVVGFTFFISIGQIYHFLGLWLILALIIVATMSYAIGLSFVYLTKIYPSSYVTSYVVARSAFNRFIAFISLWSTYLQSPIVAISSIAGMIWAFQGTYLYKHYLWVVILLAAFLFILIIFVMNHGLRASNRLLYIFSSLKWLVILGAIAFSTIYFLYSLHDFARIKSHIVNGNVDFSFANLCTSIMLLFLSFVGIEGTSSISADIDNPTKTLPKVVLYTMIAGTFLYLIYFVMVLNVIGPNGPDGLYPTGTSSETPNSINSILFTMLGGVATGGWLVLLYFIISSQIANKCTVRTQSAWINSRVMLVLTIEGMLPKRFGKINKHGQFYWCIWLDSIISGIFIILFVVLSITNPEIINDLSNVLSAIVLSYLFIYMISVLAIMKKNYNKEINLNKKEKLWVYYAFASMCIAIFTFIYPIISDTFDTKSSARDIVMAWFPVIFYVLGVLCGVVIFLIGKYIMNKKDTHFPTSLIDFIIENPELEFYKYFPNYEQHPLYIEIESTRKQRLNGEKNN